MKDHHEERGNFGRAVLKVINEMAGGIEAVFRAFEMGHYSFFSKRVGKYVQK